MAFAFVLFGEGKTTIFNTNCRNVSVLRSLKEICRQVVGQNDNLDLASESGECKNLFRCLNGYASDVIAPREKLVLLRVEEASKADNLANAVKFVPLLNGAEEDQDFMTMLNPAAAQKRPSKSSMGKGKGLVYLNNVSLAGHSTPPSAKSPHHPRGRGQPHSQNAN